MREKINCTPKKNKNKKSALRPSIAPPELVHQGLKFSGRPLNLGFGVPYYFFSRMGAFFFWYLNFTTCLGAYLIITKLQVKGVTNSLSRAIVRNASTGRLIVLTFHDCREGN